MKNRKILFGVVLLIAIVIGIYIALHNSSTRKSETAHVIGQAPSDFHGIPPEGIGGDPDLNKEKNRWAASAVFTPESVTQIISLQHGALDIMGKERRSRWSSAAVNQAAENENRAVQVIGYLAHAKESGSEACNGHSDIYHDFHLWITESPGEDKNRGIVIEAIPYWKEQFPAWQLQIFEKLASQNAKVRVSGWILWDEEHGDEVGKSRGSLWEIHPFTKFEVFSGGKWVELGMEVL